MKPDNWAELTPNQQRARRRSRHRWLARIREAEEMNRQHDMAKVYAACLRAKRGLARDGGWDAELRAVLEDTLDRRYAKQEAPGVDAPEASVPTAIPSQPGNDSGCSAKSA
jgi:hypothetical protein